jgi:hypothetical protein
MEAVVFSIFGVLMVLAASVYSSHFTGQAAQRMVVHNVSKSATIQMSGSVSFTNLYG